MMKGAPGDNGLRREVFGQVAVRKGYVTPQQVEEALARQREMIRDGAVRKPIGMILLELGHLGTTELIDCLTFLNVPAPTRKTTRRVAPPS